eukprot:2428473-Prymnesium_polylepis.1
MRRACRNAAVQETCIIVNCRLRPVSVPSPLIVRPRAGIRCPSVARWRSTLSWPPPYLGPSGCDPPCPPSVNSLWHSHQCVKCGVRRKLEYSLSKSGRCGTSERGSGGGSNCGAPAQVCAVSAVPPGRRGVRGAPWVWRACSPRKPLPSPSPTP